MRRPWMPLICCLLSLTLAAPVWAEDAPSPPRAFERLQFPSLPPLQRPDYVEFQLANGLRVYLIEDHRLPLVSGSLLIRTGSRLDPPGQGGLADFTAELLRSGGSQRYPREALNRWLETRAADIESDMGTAAGTVGFSGLATDLSPLLATTLDLVRHPVFPQDRLDLLKQQYRGAIARQNDKPESIVRREFPKLVYGAQSPYAAEVTLTDLDRIRRSDLIDFHRRYYQPQRMILGLVGDFDAARVKAELQQLTADWSAGTTRDLPIPSARQVNASGLWLVDRPQQNQSYVQMGQLGDRFSDPDFPALSVLNEVLNGFGGRLYNQVRSRQGLAYSVYSRWQPAFDYPGLFVAGAQTRTETTAELIRAIRAQLELVRREPISDRELSEAKERVLNTFIFNFQTPAQTLSRLLRYAYYGYPADQLFRYQKQVAAVTVADVQRVARQRIRPDRLVTLVVGNGAALKAPLASLELGPVQALSLEPTTPAAAPPAAAVPRRGDRE